MLFSCAADKAPGPDGFTMAFFQRSWDFIKAEVMGTSQSFLSGMSNGEIMQCHFHCFDSEKERCN